MLELLTCPPRGRGPNSLLFVNGGALIAQPFDTSKLAATGEKTVVAAQVRYRRWREAGFSASDNGILLYQSGSTEDRRFTWFDRHGKSLKTIGPPNGFAAFNLSPDERYLALWSGNDPATSSTTAWLMDLSREGALSRFSELGEMPEFLPVWSPDSRELLFSRGDERHMRLLRRPLNGGPVQTVLDSEGPKFPSDWSSDGRFLAFSSQWPDYQHMHIWAMQVNGSAAPQAFSRHAYEELAAYFSPADSRNGPRWMAYTSAETGRNEVYVQDFPAGGRRWTASVNGGWLPHWRRDGGELFYLTLDGTLMAVPVHSGANLELGAPHALFTTGLRPTPIQTLMNQYAVSQDGQRFLLNVSIADDSARTITVIAGW